MMMAGVWKRCKWRSVGKKENESDKENCGLGGLIWEVGIFGGRRRGLKFQSHSTDEQAFGCWGNTSSGLQGRANF